MNYLLLSIFNSLLSPTRTSLVLYMITNKVKSIFLLMVTSFVGNRLQFQDFLA